MRLRCPLSTYKGVGRLASYRWIINGRGYANVVPSQDNHDVVYGLIYNLTAVDETDLDINEGVPYAYTKETMAVEFWASKDRAKVDVTQQGEIRNMLVYIDRKRTKDAKPKEEYVHRMNRGIADAVAMGVPSNYVEDVMRPFIPVQASKEAEEIAKKQAIRFEDE